MTALLLDTALRVSVVTAIALVGVLLLRRRSAAIRHWVLASATACALVLPALQPLLPSLPVPVTVPAPLARAVSCRAHAAHAATGGEASPLAQSEPSGRRGTLPRCSAGSGWAAPRSFSPRCPPASRGWRGSRRARRRSRMPPGSSSSRELSQRYGLTRSVRLLQSTHPALLVTWGIRSPKILLPAAANAWPDRTHPRRAGARARARPAQRLAVAALGGAAARALLVQSAGVAGEPPAARRERARLRRRRPRDGCGRASVRHASARSGEGIFGLPPRLVARARDRITVSPRKESQGHAQRSSQPSSSHAAHASRHRDCPSLASRCRLPHWPRPRSRPSPVRSSIR